MIIVCCSYCLKPGFSSSRKTFLLNLMWYILFLEIIVLLNQYTRHIESLFLWIHRFVCRLSSSSRMHQDGLLQSSVVLSLMQGVKCLSWMQCNWPENMKHKKKKTKLVEKSGSFSHYIQAVFAVLLFIWHIRLYSEWNDHAYSGPFRPIEQRVKSSRIYTPIEYWVVWFVFQRYIVK